jgi:hypothetical protein
MSDTPNEPTPEPEQQDNLADLRRAAEDGRKARDTAARLERELAFTKAGIDTDTGVGKLLFQSYDGDPTKDAVLAAAAEYGITPATPEAPAPEPPAIPDDERNMSRERQQLATGSEPPAPAQEGHPAEVGLAEFLKARSQGVAREDAADHYFGRVIAAAAKGDKRVIWDADAHRAAARAAAER